MNKIVYIIAFFVLNVTYAQIEPDIENDSILNHFDDNLRISKNKFTCECAHSNAIDITVKCCPVEKNNSNMKSHDCCCLKEGLTEECTPTIKTMVENKEGSCNCCSSSAKNKTYIKEEKSNF